MAKRYFYTIEKDIPVPYVLAFPILLRFYPDSVRVLSEFCPQFPGEVPGKAVVFRAAVT